MSETQETISKWAEETFGPAGSNFSVAARANQEMAELLTALASDDNHPKAVEEMADIVIVMMRGAERLGLDLMAEIDRKMAINRARSWRLTGTGHGYHVKDARPEGDRPQGRPRVKSEARGAPTND
jgi:NTP pyrophosphatase (non-canonical NTP hydrolase)